MIPTQENEGITFESLIGNPLRAAVKAQRDMAKEALNYVKEEGIKTDKEGNGELCYVTLSFVRDGKKAKMRIPLLLLVPYPALGISQMTYKFTAKVDANSTVAVAVGRDLPDSTTEKAKDAAVEAISKLAKSNENGGLSASYSSKRDSSATRNSRYSVETTIDVSITATSQEPPLGISKMMDVLEKSTEVINSNGELNISAEQLTLSQGHAVLTASYRDGNGDYHREKLECVPLNQGAAPTPLPSGDNMLFLFSEKGTYAVKGGIFQRVVFVS